LLKANACYSYWERLAKTSPRRRMVPAGEKAETGKHRKKPNALPERSQKLAG